MKVYMIRDYQVINGTPGLEKGKEYELEHEEAMDLIQLRFAEFRGSALEMFKIN